MCNSSNLVDAAERLHVVLFAIRDPSPPRTHFRLQICTPYYLRTCPVLMTSTYVFQFTFLYGHAFVFGILLAEIVARIHYLL
jgi:hypothetical protein